MPYLINLPLTLIKSGSGILVEKTLPEINLLLAAAGIIIAIFIECYLTVCASGFLMDRDAATG